MRRLCLPRPSPFQPQGWIAFFFSFPSRLFPCACHSARVGPADEFACGGCYWGAPSLPPHLHWCLRSPLLVKQCERLLRSQPFHVSSSLFVCVCPICPSLAEGPITPAGRVVPPLICPQHPQHPLQPLHVPMFMPPSAGSLPHNMNRPGDVSDGICASTARGKGRSKKTHSSAPLTTSRYATVAAYQRTATRAARSASPAALPSPPPPPPPHRPRAASSARTAASAHMTTGGPR